VSVPDKLFINRRLLKTALLSVLEQADLEIVVPFLHRHPQHLLLNALFSALSNANERVRWNAVFCFGQIVPAIAGKDLEASRIIMRRFLWSLNDESGGIGWGAPEAMAEIMSHSVDLRREYLHMLISYMRQDGDEPFQDGNYIELPFLQRGLLWGIGRLSEIHRVEMREKQLVGDIMPYLVSPDHHVVGMAIWCLGFLGGAQTILPISGFLNNLQEVRLFANNTLTTVTLAKLAEDSLRMNKTSP
jgi:hypothetical protein